MTENKRFDLTFNQNDQWDIIDKLESEQKNAICIYNDLGQACFSSAPQVCELMNELHEENTQLRETIDELRTIYKEKDIEVEHINNIYKEFGFKGLIDYAKDKLYNYGAVREVEEGLWLLATGGWSDNEFWLDCLLHWNFMYAKGHYRATTSGGGYYYSEKPYADIKVILEDLE